MAISTIGSYYASNQYGSEKRVAVDKKATATKAPRKDKVEISQRDTDATIKHLTQVVKNTPEIRLPLVKELQAKIASGDYPLESKLSEAVKKMIQAKILNS